MATRWQVGGPVAAPGQDPCEGNTSPDCLSHGDPHYSAKKQAAEDAYKKAAGIGALGIAAFLLLRGLVR